VAEDTEVYVFGSQAVLGQFPMAPKELLTSIEVDLQPKNKPENTDVVSGSLGEESPFHISFGFYVDCVSIELATLPPGWEERTVAVESNLLTGHCLDVHDLAASKLAAYRDKDRVFVSVLIKNGMVDVQTLVARIRGLPMDPSIRQSRCDWVQATAAKLTREP